MAFPPVFDNLLCLAAEFAYVQGPGVGGQLEIFNPYGINLKSLSFLRS